jgi:thioesterase domain-containing protein/acyl carrier protein
LDHLWIFDRLKVTSEDKERTELYRREAARNEARSAATDIESFLESLELQCSISDMTPEQVPRVSQLSLRTNQFNSTTIRRSEAEIRAIVDRSEKRILTVSVSDRFGDYGLVGSVVYELSGGSLEVDSFMLSCRVLGRGVEHEVLRRLAKIAGDAGATVINIAFDPTPKNIPFLNFLTEVAGDCKFDSRGRTEYRIPVAVAKSARPANLSAPQDRGKRTQDHERSNDSGSRVRDTAYIDIAGLLSGPVAGWAIPGSPGAERGALSSEFIGARTDTELELAEIWARVLSVKDIGVRDDFFEMGGDSLSAVSMFVEIETTLGVSLPLSAIIGAPTIEKLARYIDAQCGGFGWKYVVPLQPEGARTPLFCMHAAGGNVLFYRDLAAELGPDQPVYGVQARGVADRSETAHDCVEEMAREYLVEIREAQPHGPYRLCGSSFGGLVAFEAARQLKAAGEEVAIVALFDTYAPGYLDAHQELRSGGCVSRILGRMRNMRKQIDSIATLGGKAAFVAGRLSKAKTQAKRKFLWKKNAFAVQYRKATGKELPLDLQRNQSAIRRALKSYRPHFYDGQIALFRASEQPVLDSPDPLLGWGEYAARVEDFEVVGSHGALSVYPFASDLAVKLAPLLTDVSKSSVRELSVAV